MTHAGKDGSVTFRFFRPGAREVLLAGDFNRWEQVPMRCEPHGWWSLDLPLPAGDYRFRYIADGQWYTDFASNGIEVTRLGWNSVLVVPERAGKPAQPKVEMKLRKGGRLQLA
jgi:1,4-alpha-glucan branching enzyme